MQVAYGRRSHRFHLKHHNCMHCMKCKKNSIADILNLPCRCIHNNGVRWNIHAIWYGMDDSSFGAVVPLWWTLLNLVIFCVLLTKLSRLYETHSTDSRFLMMWHLSKDMMKRLEFEQQNDFHLQSAKRCTNCFRANPKLITQFYIF